MRQATRGLELTRLKSLLDDGGDHHSFFRLAYHDLQGVYRTAVLQHVAAEGDALLAAWSSAHPGGPPGVTLKVVSDIDDTLVCSAGHYPAGVDRRLPKGCPYPGACALLNELDAGHALRVSEAVAARLALELGIHVEGPRSLDERQRTLYRAIKTSWELLSDREKDALARFSVSFLL